MKHISALYVRVDYKFMISCKGCSAHPSYNCDKQWVSLYPQLLSSPISKPAVDTKAYSDGFKHSFKEILIKPLL